jgi:hypothetical protein
MSNTSISNIEWDLPIVSHFNKTATRVNDVKGEHRKDDRGAVEHINVCLIHDDLSLPFIRKFVCPINGADEHPDSCNPHAKEYLAEICWEGVKGLLW